MPPKRAIKKSKVKTQTFYEPYQVRAEQPLGLPAGILRRARLSVAAALLRGSWALHSCLLTSSPCRCPGES